MSKVKYRVREYTPNKNQSGSHSFYAESVIGNEIDNAELAEKIARRTGFRPYECQAVVAAIAEIVAEEVQASNRVSLSNEQGTKMVSFYPKVSGSVSDKDITEETTAANKLDSKVPIRTVATEADLTSNRLSWTVAATVGVKYSKLFSLGKNAQKVKNVYEDATTPGTSGESSGGGQNPGTGYVPDYDGLGAG